MDMNRQLHLLLADDDADDRYFFDEARKESAILSDLNTVEDGEKLMNYLNKNSAHLPDILFLDLNMPRKNGAECLKEIKSSNVLKQLPVVIYSTSLNMDTADSLYQEGAHYYVQKAGLDELESVVHKIFSLVKSKKFIRPSRSEFVFNMVPM